MNWTSKEQRWRARRNYFANYPSLLEAVEEGGSQMVRDIKSREIHLSNEIFINENCERRFGDHTRTGMYYLWKIFAKRRNNDGH